MLRLEVATQVGLTPALSHFLDCELLDRAAAQPGRAWLRVYDLAGDVLSFGRYHLVPADAADEPVQLHRRLGGGRVMPLGAGFALLSLTLPHRSALVSDEPLALRAEQALNRCVRGLLGGLRRLGVQAFYPGRDCITVGGRTLALVSLESDARGATVFEAAVAIDGDWQRLAALVTAVDRDGVVSAQLFAPDAVTTLAAHGATPTLTMLADAIGGAYMQEFDLIGATAAEQPAPKHAEERARAWLASRRPPTALDRHAIEWGQLGVFEVYLAARDGVIVDALLGGDFIANSASVTELEEQLRGCRLERTAIAAIVDAVYADRRNFLLGVGPLAAVVETILGAR
jgi:hypothetical protein